MGTEDNNSFRLNRMESDIVETKADVKEISKEQQKQKETLIKMGSDMKQNLATNKTIKNAAIGFLVVNVLGLIWTFLVRI